MSSMRVSRPTSPTSSRTWALVGAMLAATVFSAVGCGRTGGGATPGGLRGDAQRTLDAMIRGDASATHDGYSDRCRRMVAEPDLRAEFALLDQRLPKMKEWRFEIVSIDEAGDNGTVRTIVVDGRGDVVDARGFSNNEDAWRFVYERDAWRLDFCKS